MVKFIENYEEINAKITYCIFSDKFKIIENNFFYGYHLVTLLFYVRNLSANKTPSLFARIGFFDIINL